MIAFKDGLQLTDRECIEFFNEEILDPKSEIETALMREYVSDDQLSFMHSDGMYDVATVLIMVNMNIMRERERCLAACELSESETNQLYSAETARYIETKIRKGQ